VDEAETGSVQVRASIEPRTTIRAGDLGAVVAFQGREYSEQWGLNAQFEAHVAETVADAGGRLALDPSYGRMWLVEDEQGLIGSIAITHEEGTTGKVRWFLVARRAQGRGIGRQLFDEAMAYARERYDSLVLETFSELETAAAMYRAVGFEVVDSAPQTEWGREIQLQHYEVRF
jgi:ribosomal protein S18 acetylase RimI-like enzyme